MHQIENSHIAEITPLISPRDLKAKHPLPPAVGDLVLAARRRDPRHSAWSRYRAADGGRWPLLDS